MPLSERITMTQFGVLATPNKTLGHKLVDFETSYGGDSFWVDITSFMNKNLGRDKFYIAFENHARADIEIGSVSIEAVP